MKSHFNLNLVLVLIKCFSSNARYILYRVNHQVGDYILLTLNSFFLFLPNSGWAAANLAEFAWHVGNMVEISNKLNKA